MFALHALLVKWSTVKIKWWMVLFLAVPLWQNFFNVGPWICAYLCIWTDRRSCFVGFCAKKSWKTRMTNLCLIYSAIINLVKTSAGVNVLFAFLVILARWQWAYLSLLKVILEITSAGLKSCIVSKYLLTTQFPFCRWVLWTNKLSIFSVDRLTTALSIPLRIRDQPNEVRNVVANMAMTLKSCLTNQGRNARKHYLLWIKVAELCFRKKCTSFGGKWKVTKIQECMTKFFDFWSDDSQIGQRLLRDEFLMWLLRKKNR